MRIALQSQNAGWVIDQIVNDYKHFTRHDIVRLDDNPDLFWCVILFAFPQMLNRIPKGCVSVVHVHHIDETKLNEYDFNNYNKADLCVVCNSKTKEAASRYMTIPILEMPYWVLTSSSGHAINASGLPDSLLTMRPSSAPTCRIVSLGLICVPGSRMSLMGP